MSKEYDETYRPQYHFSARKNWINDPNGLVYYDGEYHLFFQHNPDALSWGNMTWGHAVSPDLLHWTQLDHALLPDSWGTMFSGSAVVDWNNTAGFQGGREKTLVAIYTLHRQADVDSAVEDQCIAYSNDRGRTWTKYAGNPVLPTPHLVNRGFRDPKVFWHEPAARWVMIIYHRVGNQLYGSPDLKRWTLLSEFAGLPYECPDMYELPLDGDARNTRWIAEGGNGDYFVGRFDGTTFTPETEKITCDYGPHYYASQTFSDARDGRRIQVAWMNGGNFPSMPFTNQMSIPRELTLVTTPAGPRMLRKPVREIEAIRGRQWKFENLPLTAATANPLGAMEGDAIEIDARIRLGSAAKVGLCIRGESLHYSAADRTLRFLGRNAPLWAPGGVLDLRILVDRSSIEILADGGLITMSNCLALDPGDRSLSVFAKGGEAKIDSLVVRELQSTWRLGPRQ